MTGVFTAGSVLTAANLNTAINSLTLNAQTGAGYPLVLADAGKLVTLSNASAQNLTLPLNSSVAFATGTVVECLTIGAGTWTVTPTGGVTYTGPTSLPTGTRLRLTKTGTDTWYGSVLGGGGLVYVGGGTVTAGSAINVNNCFSSAYENYRIYLRSDVAATFRYRVSGADNTSAVYNDQYVDGTSTSASAGLGNNQTSNSLFGPGVMMMDVFAPFSAVPTLASGFRNRNANTVTLFTFYHSGSTSFDGFSLLGTTMTATVRVYAYPNS